MATLEYDFRIVGMDAVKKAFASLEKRAQAHNEKMEQMYGRQAARGGAGGARGASGGRRQFDSHVKERKRFRDREDREHAQALKKQERREEQAVKARERAAAKEARDRQRATERVERDRQRAHQREERALRQQNRARDRMREQDWNRRSAWHRREEREGVRAYERQQAAIVARRQRRVGYVTGALRDTASTVGRVAVGAAAVGAGSLIAASYQSGRDAYRASTALAAQSKQAGNQKSMKEIHEGILSTAGAITQKTGIERGQIIRAMAGVHEKAGNLQTSTDLASYVAAVSEASGSDIGDVANLAGMAFKSAADKGMSVTEATAATKRMIGIMGQHAAAGSIEMRDYAAYAPTLLASARKMGGGESFVDMVAMTSAVAQGSLGGGATDAAEAATATSRLVDDLMQNQKKIKKLTNIDVMDVDPTTGVRKLKSFEKLVPALLAAAGGDESKLMEMGIGVRGNRAITGMLDTYVQGTKSSGAGSAEEKGAQAVKDALLTAMRAKGISEEDWTAMAKERESLDPYARLEKSLTRLADTAIPPLTRVIEKLAAKFGVDASDPNAPPTQAAETFDTIADVGSWAIDNWKKASGLAIGGYFGLKALGGAAASGLQSAGTAALVKAGILTVGETAAAGATAATAATAAEGAATVALSAGATAALGTIAAGLFATGSVGAAAYLAYDTIKDNINPTEGVDFVYRTPDDDVRVEDPFATTDRLNREMALAYTSKPAVAEKEKAADTSSEKVTESAAALGKSAVALTAAADAINNAAGALNRGDAPAQSNASSGGR